MELNFSVFGRRFGLSLYSRRIRKEIVTGYTNRTKNGMYIITLDYDNMSPDDLPGEIGRLQTDFRLGDFHLFESGNGYHAVCLDKVTLKELQDIMLNSSVDPNYMRVPFMSGHRLWVLRLSDKDEKSVRYMGTMRGFDNVREKSLAHAILLNNLFKIGIDEESVFFDTENNLKLASYPLS